MELKQVRCLAAVAEHGSFRRAAAAIPLAQPAVSSHVARLEAELGVELLRRSRRGTELTAAGRALLPGLQTLLDTEADLKNEARDIKTGRTGLVRISAVNAVIGPLVAPALVALRNSAELTIELTESIPDHIEAAIDGGTIDIGLTAQPGRIRPRGQAEKLGVDPIGLCVRSDHELAELSEVSLADVLDLQLILPDDGLLRRMAIGHFPANMIESASVVSHHWTTLDLVTAGLGVALTPLISLARFPKLSWLPIADASLTATLWMIEAPDLTPAARRAVESLRQHASAARDAAVARIERR